MTHAQEDVDLGMGERRALTSREIKLFLSAHVISADKHHRLEAEGKLDPEACLMCLASASRRSARWVEFPCQHRYHGRCVLESLEQDVSRCRIASCVFDVKDSFELHSDSSVLQLYGQKH